MSRRAKPATVGGYNGVPVVMPNLSDQERAAIAGAIYRTLSASPGSLTPSVAESILEKLQTAPPAKPERARRPAKIEQPALFAMRDDTRPAGTRTAAERYAEPSLFTLLETN